MTDEQRQRLSVLLDGELDPANTSRLLDALAREPPLRDTWERYHLIGQAIRGEHIDLAHRVVANRVQRALAAEPVILAGRRRHRWPRARRPMAGVALAATLAFVALFAAPVLFQRLRPSRRPSPTVHRSPTGIGVWIVPNSPASSTSF